MNAAIAGKEASLGEAVADEPTTANPVPLAAFQLLLVSQLLLQQLPGQRSRRQEHF